MRAAVAILGFFWAASAAAQSEIARDIPARDNPRFLPLFLERFSDGFRARTRFENEMPESLRRIWRDNMSEPRDFAEEILPGVKWPRFQWGIEAESGAVRPVELWFELKNPERLSREWNRAFCFEKEKNYIGVNWTADLSRVEFFFKDSGRLKLRRYLARQLAGEYDLRIQTENGQRIATASAGDKTLYTLVPVGRVAPRLLHPQAAHLQFAVQREFLISPRAYARSTDGNWERVFFP